MMHGNATPIGHVRQPDIFMVLPSANRLRRALHEDRLKPVIIARMRFSPCSMLANTTPPMWSATKTKAILLAVA